MTTKTVATNTATTGSVTTIEDLAALRERYAQPSPRSVGKQLDRIDAHMRRFIALSPFVVLSTSSADGRLDASPRGGSPGFVVVEDEKTLLIPDWPGNNRLDSMNNLLEQDGIGLLFMVPGVDETLRVAGRATLTVDETRRAACRERDRLPKLVVAVRVEEAYLHCAKAFMRSKLWSAEAQVSRDALPTLGEMLRDQIDGAREAPLESEEAMRARYRKALY